MMFSWSTNEGIKYTKFQFQLCGVHELFPRKHFWAIHISRLAFAFARVILLYDYKFSLSVAWWCICTIKKIKPTSDFLITTLSQMRYWSSNYETMFLVFDHTANTTIFMFASNIHLSLIQTNCYGSKMS